MVGDVGEAIAGPNQVAADPTSATAMVATAAGAGGGGVGVVRSAGGKQVGQSDWLTLGRRPITFDATMLTWAGEGGRDEPLKSN